MKVTYAMPLSDLEQLVDKFIDNDDYMPDNLAPVKFKVTKQGFAYK